MDVGTFLTFFEPHFRTPFDPFLFFRHNKQRHAIRRPGPRKSAKIVVFDV